MNRPSPSSRRGGALITAVILATAVGLIVTHIVRTSVLERQLTARSIVKVQADNAAEMLVDYGLAQIASRFSANSAFATDEFSPSKNPLVVADELRDQLDLPGLDLDSLFLTAGKLSKPVRYYVDPANPANRFDPHKGMNVMVRILDLYGRATVKHPHFGNVTSYSHLKVQVRDAPLFAYGIFYNMDLEFHPGPAMTLTGTVHSNGTIWLNEGGGLNFEGVVTAHGDIRIGLKQAGQQLKWTTGHRGDRVRFRDVEDELQSLYRGSGPTNEMVSYYTSLSEESVFADLGYESWREYATNEFGGNLQSGVHGVPRSNPSGVRPYVPNEDGLTEKQNHAYSLIEPNLYNIDPNHKGDAEREKFARKAGMIIRVHRDTDGDLVDDDRGIALPEHAVRLRSRPEIDNGWSSAARETFEHYENFAHTGRPPPPPPSDHDTEYYLSFHTLERADPKDPTSALVLTTATRVTIGPDGDSIHTTIDEISEKALALNEDFDRDQEDEDHTTDGDALRALFDEAFAAHPYRNEADTGIDYDGDGNTTDFHSGMVDRRIRLTDSSATGLSRLDLVEINLAALADILEDPDHPLFEDYTPEEFFNGVVYVEFPTDTAVTPRATDRIVRAREKMAVILTQAGGNDPKIGRVPNPSYNKAAGRSEGFTLATNAPLYTRGHFNADGRLIGDAMDSDDPDNPDPPVALAADAVTVLSENFKFADTPTVNRPKAASTEFCAAILTGLLPTSEGGRNVISGGNHNFIRFLEDWSSRTLRFRGSMACAFESEIQADRMTTDYYSPPTRDWGYFKRFASGVLPPGTPSYASYRKSSFAFLSPAEFETAVDALAWSVNLPPLP
jgi:hypothetical protein